MSDSDQTSGETPLKLLAFDTDDLCVISAQMQDSAVRVADIAFLPQLSRFGLIAARFDWESALQNVKRRRRAVLHFEYVRNVQQIGIAPNRSLVLNLLSIYFTQRQPPGGFVTLAFSGGVSIRLDVECLEAGLCDLDATWPARFTPRHKAGYIR